MKKIIISFLCFSIIVLSYPITNVSASTYVSTKYINERLVGGIVPHGVRDKVKTYYESHTVTKGKKQVLGTVTNTTKKKATISASYSKTRSRSFSIGVSIPKEILKDAVSLTISGGLSFSETITLSASVKLKAGKSHTFYYRTNTIKDKYKHIVQCQSTDISGTWKNSGSTKTKYSTVTTKAPEIIV